MNSIFNDSVVNDFVIFYRTLSVFPLAIFATLRELFFFQWFE